MKNILCVLAFALLASPTVLQAAKTRPNIIFILADDLGWGDPAFRSHPYMKTPNLDRLASQGTVFNQFYVANPVCSPSRTGFMTGHYPARHNVDGHFATHAMNASRQMPDWLDPNVTTVAQLLKNAGYVTGHFGKWHLGNGSDAPTPDQYGIEVSKTINSSDKALQLGDEATEPFFRARSTELIADEAIKFMQANRDKPFYLNVWTLLPHAPLKPTPEQLAVYEDLNPNPDNFKAPYRQYLKDATNLKSQMQVFCASVTALDAGIGRLLKAVDDLGLADNTIVVFSSDNGPEDYHIGNARNAGVGSPGDANGRKRSLYEGGIRTPLIVRWPGHIATGRVDNQSVVAAVDFLPTMCHFASIPVPEVLKPDGEDVSDILLGTARPRNRPLYWEWLFGVAGNPSYQPPKLAVRDGHWKLFMNPDETSIELYDIPSDPEEAKNVAAANPEVVARLKPELLAWYATLPPRRSGGESGQKANQSAALKDHE